MPLSIFSKFCLLSLLVMVTKANAEIKLSGSFEQGGLVIGKTEPGSIVLLNNAPLKVSPAGDFVFGFSRDDTTTYQLTITDKSGQVESKSITPSIRQYNIDRVEGIARKIMKPNPKNVERAKKDSQQIKQVRKTNSDLTAFAKGFSVPRESKITGVYGSQRFYNGVPKSPHYGVDYRGKVGAPVKAPANGKVLMWVPDMFYSGGTLVVDHGHGVTSTFLHLSDCYVKVGDKINKGQVIAAVGASGRVSGPHLDWRLNWFDVRLDPQLALKALPIN